MMDKLVLKLFRIFLVVFVFGGLFSCTSSDESFVEQVSDMQVTFEYKGRVYSYKIVDGEPSFGDDETKNLVMELDGNPHMATLVRKDGMVEIFDSYEECEKNLEAEVPLADMYKEPSRVAGEHQTKIKICQNADLTGITINLNNTSSYPLTVSNYELSGYNLAGRVTSFKLEHISTITPLAPISYVTFYEGANRTGRTLSYQTSDSDGRKLTENNLKSVAYNANGDTWNDRIKSLSLK